MSELKEKYIQFCCDFYKEHAPEDKLWFGRMYDECLQEHNKRNSCMCRWQFPLMILKDQEAKIKELKTQLNNMEACYIQQKKLVAAANTVLMNWNGEYTEHMQEHECSTDAVLRTCITELKQALRGGNEK